MRGLQHLLTRKVVDASQVFCMCLLTLNKAASTDHVQACFQHCCVTGGRKGWEGSVAKSSGDALSLSRTGQAAMPSSTPYGRHLSSSTSQSFTSLTQYMLVQALGNGLVGQL